MTEQKTNSSQKFNLSLDFRLIIVALLLVIVAMLVVWKPWNSGTGSDARTIDVVGEAVINAEPDEYVFYPTWEFKGADSVASLKQLNDKSSEVTTKLKELGIEESKIKSSSDNYEKYYIAPTDGEPTHTLRLEARVANRELAQKAQDYLITTNLVGQISPQAGFSENKRKELESQAREQATNEARAKADQSAKNLGFSIGKVKSVSDGTGFGGIEPMYARDSAATSEASPSSLQVMPGENELRYTVSVSYYLK
ncbi:MAG: SIMPL domain-containing protein [bacterium]|nr:SIMPL domain-containing protein [bacterium]